MKSEEIGLNGCSIAVIPVVRGLESNRELIRKEMDEIEPEVIALSISPEELEGLLHLDEIDVDDFALSDYEEMYVERLRQYSRVIFPPPAYTESVLYGREKRIPLASLDINERNFSELYVSLVSTSELIRHSVRKKRLKKRRFNADGPEEFAILWDRAINNLSGFRKLVEKREEYMAMRIGKLSENYRKIAAVVEVERAKGVMSRLKSYETAMPEN